MRHLPLAFLLLLSVLLAGAMTPCARRSLSEFEARVEAGDSAAMWRMALLLESGFDTIPPDTARSIDLVVRAARAGYPPAMNYLGFLYAEGRMHGGVDPDSSRLWLTRAADAGEPRAAYNLAYTLLPDTTLALPYLRRALKARLPQAMVLQADLLADGSLVSRDSTAALSLYRKALREGWRDAELRLLNLIGPGIRHLDPDSLMDQAISLQKDGAYTAASEMLLAIPEWSPRFAEALRMLGYEYALGRGLQYDYDKANQCFEQAASLGDSVAQRIIDEQKGLFPDFF